MPLLKLIHKDLHFLFLTQRLTAKRLSFHPTMKRIHLHLCRLTLVGSDKIGNSNVLLQGKASHFCPRPSSFWPRSAVIPISCCFREWHWTTLEWRWRSERKERKWGRGWLWLVSASFDTVWPSFVRAVVGSTSFLSLYGTIHFVIPYSFWNKMI